MRDNAEIAQTYDLLGKKPMRTIEGTLDIPPPAADIPARVDETGVELKRGAVLNTIAMLASNFRGVFIFLVARLLGPAALGTFSVAWANTDLASKIAVFGLDNAITTFIARSQATGNLARSRALFRAAVVLVLTQSTLVAAIGITALQMFGDRLQFPREMLSALAFVLCALPGIALYRVCTSVSRGMKVMKHDIFSRGMTEPVITTLRHVYCVYIGHKHNVLVISLNRLCECHVVFAQPRAVCKTRRNIGERNERFQYKYRSSFSSIDNNVDLACLLVLFRFFTFIFFSCT